jgi:hypothetical protein
MSLGVRFYLFVEDDPFDRLQARGWLMGEAYLWNYLSLGDRDESNTLLIAR